MITPLSDELKQEALDAYERAGKNKAAAARLLGIPITTYKSRYLVATKDYKSTPEHIQPLIPDGQKLRGVSTLYDEDNKVVLQWVKTKEDLDRTIEIITETAEALKADIPREKPVEPPAHVIADLLCSYTLTDYHMGMMAQAQEAGEDWDTDKSVEFLVLWFEAAIKAAPASKVAILCQLGDFFHFDSLDAVTPTSRHVLDTDTRYTVLVGMGVKVLRQIVRMLLEKHEHVHILMAEGNHDMASSVWLRVLFAEFYSDEPRVTVDNTAHPYYAYEWGNTSLFFHHGHKRSMGDLSKVFASLYREIFGRTKYSYGHLGNFHHAASKEDGLMIVEQHPTMAVKDAYAARGGYVANRGASVITYSKKHGEVSRVTIRPEMVTP